MFPVVSLVAAIAPLFDAVGPVVRGSPPPPPPSLPPGIAGLVVALTIVGIVWSIAKRLAGRRAARFLRVSAFGAVIGNALMDLASVLQPDRPAVVEVQREDGARRVRLRGAAYSAGEDERRS